MLARMANETGGRMTRGTNDFSLGYARAQRDLGCKYTLGFYLRDDYRARPRQIAVRVKRPGLHTLHPENYQFRTDSEKRETELTSAFHAPGMFDSGFVRASVFPLQPRTPKSWDVLIAISFPLGDTPPGTVVRKDFGAVLDRGPKIHHSFSRRVSLRALVELGSGERRFTFLEPAELAPGSYRMTVVTADDDRFNAPAAARIEIEIPPLPRKDVVLVRPILGRPRDENVLVRGDGPVAKRKTYDSEQLAGYDIVARRGAFEPMLILQTDEAAQLLTRNKACLLGKGEVPDATVRREIAQEDELVLELASRQLHLGLGGKVRCQNLYEVLQERTLAAGPYLFEATLEEKRKGGDLQEILRFAVDGEMP